MLDFLFSKILSKYPKDCLVLIQYHINTPWPWDRHLLDSTVIFNNKQEEYDKLYNKYYELPKTKCSIPDELVLKVKVIIKNSSETTYPSPELNRIYNEQNDWKEFEFNLEDNQISQEEIINKENKLSKSKKSLEKAFYIFMDTIVKAAYSKLNEITFKESDVSFDFSRKKIVLHKSFKFKTIDGKLKFRNELSIEDLITQVVISYKIMTFSEVFDTSSNSKPSNVDKKRYHTSTKLNLNKLKLSDRIPESIYNPNAINSGTTYVNKLGIPKPHNIKYNLTPQIRSFSFSPNLLNNLTTFYMDLINYRHKNNSVSVFINNYINNPLYHNIRMILDNVELKNSQKQFRIEESLTDFWRKEIVALFKDNQKLFRSEYGIKMIYNNIIKLDRDIQDLKDDKRGLKGKSYKLLLILMSNADVISIVLSNVIPFCIKYESVLNQNIISLFEKVGKEIEKVFYRNEWFKYKNRNKKDWKDKSNKILNNQYIIDINNYEIKITDDLDTKGVIFEDKLNEHDFTNKLKNIIGSLTEDDYFKLGSDLIEFISEKSSLFTIENKKVDKETMKRYIIPGINLKTHILDVITQDSDLIPMINKPENWIIDKSKKEDKFYIKKYGGFISNKRNKKHFLKKSHKNVGPSRLHNLDIINAINYLSSIKYCINVDLLKIIFELLNKNDDRINKLIKISLHPQTKDVFKLSKDKEKKKEFYEILKHNSQYYVNRGVLQIALLLSKWCSNKKNGIYFPLFVDWRGRILTNTGFFSYQQGELARSLILFKEGEILNKLGLEALKVYTANCFGIDKKPYNDRLNWVENFLDKIITLDIDFIFEADEPFLFLACCLELKGYYNDPDNFISRLPIYKDATCSGLQHLSIMISDINLAKYVNILKSNKDDTPNDLYGFMVTKVNIKIKELIEKAPEYSKLDYINIVRKFIKRAIMTIPYGVTIRGIVNQLKTDFFQIVGMENGKPVYGLIDNKYDKYNFGFHLNNKEINALGKILHDILYETFGNLTLLVDYFKIMNKELKNLNLHPIWLTPGGLIIEQRYVFTEENELNSSILGKRKSITRRVPIKDKINLRKQNEGIVPNLVHSFDASNISLLIKELLKNKHNINILTIHDCFACLSNNVELMTWHVKVAFSLLYSNKTFVNDYHNFIIEYLIKSGFTILNNTVYHNNKKVAMLPTPPNFDSFEEFKDNILGSQYFIN